MSNSKNQEKTTTESQVLKCIFYNQKKNKQKNCFPGQCLWSDTFLLVLFFFYLTLLTLFIFRKLVDIYAWTCIKCKWKVRWNVQQLSRGSLWKHVTQEFRLVHSEYYTFTTKVSIIYGGRKPWPIWNKPDNHLKVADRPSYTLPQIKPAS